MHPRLRGPIRPIELQVDPETGMKNYISNTRGDWATSAAYVKYSFERCIHHGRLYTSGHGFFKGKDEDLAEGLRFLGQGLHCLEDFGAHTNYVELALRELGLTNVFPHTGTATMINLRGKHTFPLVTGTFGMVDFFHSVLGEATDHFTQSEINEMDNALGSAQSSQSSSLCKNLINLLSKIPGTSALCAEAEKLQASSQAQAAAGGGTRAVGDYDQQAGWQDPNAGYQQPQWNQHPPQPQWGQPQQPPQWGQNPQPQWNQPPPHQNQWDHQAHEQSNQQPPQWNQLPPHQQTASTANPGAGLPGLPNFDPSKTVAQIYPILIFRDKVVRTISSIISKIPGLESLFDKITETLTVFILSLLAPFIRPLINALTTQLQASSSAVVDSSGKHQYEPWTDPYCTDPTHSMLSKDHFSNILNEPAGLVASEILKFVVPRVMYAWDHPNVPVQQVLDDCMRVFHHPAARDERIEVHRTMFDVVARWARNHHNLSDILSSDAVRQGRNHRAKPVVTGSQPAQQQHGHAHSGSTGGASSFAGYGGGSNHQHHHSGSSSTGAGGHSSSNPLANLASHLPLPGGMANNINSTLNKFGSFVPGGLGSFGGSHGGRRSLDDQEGDVQRQDGHGHAGDAGAGSRPGTGYGNMPPPAGYEHYAPGGEYRPPAGYDNRGQSAASGGYGAGESASYYGTSSQSGGDGYYR